MAPHLAEIWRHPVKGIAAEPLERVALEAGRAMPWDRAFAVAHGASDWDPAAPAWVPRRNFVVQAHVPELARTAAAFDAASGTLALSHPERPEIAFAPGTAAGDAALSDWIAPLADARQPGPYRVARLDGQAMTDMPEPYVSVLSLASLRAFGERVGRALGVRRFRGNLWLDGLAPWEEEGWVGREIRVGPVRLRVDEPIGRCRATEASPESGDYDLAVVAELRRARGHTDFGVYATVLDDGAVARGDAVAHP